MSWSGSAIFRQFVADMAGNTAAFDLSGASIDTFKAALYNNTITPDKDVSAANSAYNAGQWASAGEVSDSTHWASGGQTITTPAITTPSTGVVMFDADDTPSSDAAATLASVNGVLVYDNTLAAPVAKQGVSFHYLGGDQSVTLGTFTVVWHANGLWRITV